MRLFGKTAAPAPRSPGLDVDRAAATQAAVTALAVRLAAQVDRSDGEVARKALLRQLARAERVNVQLRVVREPFRDPETGHPMLVLALARAHARDGQWQDADGSAAASDPFFDEVREHPDQLEARMRSTAVTRAKSRAIEDLLGIDLDQLLGGDAKAARRLVEASTTTREAAA